MGSTKAKALPPNAPGFPLRSKWLGTLAGRSCQLVDPKDLLNRWIIRLDCGVDFLTLRTDVKVPVPFETMVVFSTNLDPQDLADKAFLRRIQNKIKTDAISPEIFDAILSRVCEDHLVTWSEEMSKFTRDTCPKDGGADVLRSCYPRDIILILKTIESYEKRPPELSSEDVRRAVKLYFAS